MKILRTCCLKKSAAVFSKFGCGLLASAMLLSDSMSLAGEAVTSFVVGLGGYANGTAGWTFQPAIAISVTSLGCFDYIASGQSPIYVGLWGSDGSLLASNTITASSPLFDITRYEPITPV